MTITNIKRMIPEVNSDKTPEFNICGRYFYFDKVQFWTKTVLYSEEIDIINRHVNECRRTKLNKDERREKGRFMARLGWHWRYVLLQPQPAALRYLHELLGDDVLVNYTELAMELITENDQETRRLQDFLEMHWWQAWRSQRQVSQEYDGTIYSGNRAAANRYASYADKPSKITGENNCCKPEWRITGKQACQAKGLDNFAVLIDFDHEAFWRTHLRLAEIDINKLQRDYDRLFRRRSERYRPNPHANLMLRMANYHGLSNAASVKDLGAVQDIKSGWKFSCFKLRKYLKSISNECILGIQEY